MTSAGMPALAAMTEAIAWLKAYGWPTQNDDFALARRLMSDGDTGTCRLQALTDALGGPSQPDAVHRAVLCFLVIHAAEAGSAPTPGGR